MRMFTPSDFINRIQRLMRIWEDMDLDQLRLSREILLSGLKNYIHDDPERGIRETRAEFENCKIEIDKIEKDRNELKSLIDRFKKDQPERLHRLDEDYQNYGILWTELMDARDGLNELLAIYDIVKSPLEVFLNDAGKAILPGIREIYKGRKKIEYAYLIFALDDLNMLAISLRELLLEKRQISAIHKALTDEFGKVGTYQNLQDHLMEKGCLRKADPVKLAKPKDILQKLAINLQKIIK